MLLLRHYNKNAYDRRYGIFKKYVLSYYLIFLFATLVGAIICSSFMLTEKGGSSFESFLDCGATIFGGTQPFVSAISAAGFWLLILTAGLILGVTVYAPVYGGVAMLISGIRLGCLVRFYTGALMYNNLLPLYLSDCVFSVLCAVLSAVFLAFSSCVAFRLFTPDKKELTEDDRIFGGTLFNSEYFMQTVNLRFLSVYISIFILFGAVCYLLAAAKIFVENLFII